MKAILASLLVLVLACTGCTTSTSTLVTALNAVSDAASVAVVVTQALVSTGTVDQATANEVSSYATAVGNAVTASITELDSNDTNPQKITVIVADFANVATPAFGANAPQISAAITAVSAAIKIFLTQLQSTGVLTMAKAHPTVKPTAHMGMRDKLALRSVRSKTKTMMTAAAKLKK